MSLFSGEYDQFADEASFRLGNSLEFRRSADSSVRRTMKTMTMDVQEWSWDEDGGRRVGTRIPRTTFSVWKSSLGNVSRLRATELRDRPLEKAGEKPLSDGFQSRTKRRRSSSRNKRDITSGRFSVRISVGTENISR